MFYWTKNVQSFSKDGWNYRDKIQELSKGITETGEYNRTLIMSIDCILKTGSVDCDSAEDMTDQLNDVLSTITSFKLPTVSPTRSISPSEAPTGFPTG